MYLYKKITQRLPALSTVSLKCSWQAFYSLYSFASPPFGGSPTGFPVAGFPVQRQRFIPGFACHAPGSRSFFPNPKIVQRMLSQSFLFRNGRQIISLYDSLFFTSLDRRYTACMCVFLLTSQLSDQITGESSDWRLPLAGRQQAAVLRKFENIPALLS
jgi:hypothetical protein